MIWIIFPSLKDDLEWGLVEKADTYGLLCTPEKIIPIQENGRGPNEPQIPSNAVLIVGSKLSASECTASWLHELLQKTQERRVWVHFGGGSIAGVRETKAVVWNERYPGFGKVITADCVEPYSAGLKQHDGASQLIAKVASIVFARREDWTHWQAANFEQVVGFLNEAWESRRCHDDAVVGLAAMAAASPTFVLAAETEGMPPESPSSNKVVAELLAMAEKLVVGLKSGKGGECLAAVRGFTASYRELSDARTRKDAAALGVKTEGGK